MIFPFCTLGSGYISRLAQMDKKRIPFLVRAVSIERSWYDDLRSETRETRVRTLRCQGEELSRDHRSGWWAVGNTRHQVGGYCAAQSEPAVQARADGSLPGPLEKRTG